MQKKNKQYAKNNYNNSYQNDCKKKQFINKIIDNMNQPTDRPIDRSTRASASMASKAIDCHTGTRLISIHISDEIGFKVMMIESRYCLTPSH